MDIIIWNDWKWNHESYEAMCGDYVWYWDSESNAIIALQQEINNKIALLQSIDYTQIRYAKSRNEKYTPSTS